jgi:hypothetical protein
MGKLCFGTPSFGFSVAPGFSDTTCIARRRRETQNGSDEVGADDLAGKDGQVLQIAVTTGISRALIMIDLVQCKPQSRSNPKESSPIILLN